MLSFLSRLVPRRKEPEPPRGHLHPRALQAEHEADFSVQAAGKIGQTLGTFKYLIAQSAFIAGWALCNLTGVLHLDPWPLIFLNLCLSMQAAYTGPILQMTGNHQSKVDRAHAENAYAHVDEVNAKQDHQIGILQGQNEEANRTHTEILTVLAHLNRRFDQLEERHD